FYLTSSVLQARNFIRSSVVKAQRFGKIPKTRNSGFVSSFRYHADGLRVYRFEKTDRDWLWFIAQNRRPYLAKDLAGRLDPDAFSADVIIGRVANDKTNTTITAYLNGLRRYHIRQSRKFCDRRIDAEPIGRSVLFPDTESRRSSRIPGGRKVCRMIQ
ncbi:MAG: DUF3990 domain-containing protein, partial [Oscillospiraceae bacterium]|nr:DUF3990 domain-containing protein [Oscillospiraceae bacterium]